MGIHNGGFMKEVCYEMPEALAPAIDEKAWRSAFPVERIAGSSSRFLSRGNAGNSALFPGHPFHTLLFPPASIPDLDSAGDARRYCTSHGLPDRWPHWCHLHAEDH